jgi:predicted SAM-dependent methyltransferase
MLLVKIRHLLKFKRIPHFNNKFQHKVLKLNLGCGNDHKPNWVNIDAERGCKPDICFDLSKGIPFANNSVDYIYNEHFLEHLSVSESVFLVNECIRVLKKNRVMRIAVPDLEATMRLYFNPNWKTDLQDFFKKHGMSHIKTKAELVNTNFRAWGHKWLYDKEELERRLNDVGFYKLKFCEFNKSDISDLCNLESRGDVSLIVEVTK